MKCYIVYSGKCGLSRVPGRVIRRVNFVQFPPTEDEIIALEDAIEANYGYRNIVITNIFLLSEDKEEQK